ncbi:MAG TPA: hypothetical protein VIY98_00070 [Nitrososphaeraceae archaeon]|jgi:hypothetical protein
MEYKLLIGNNFVFGKPKKIYYKDSHIFSIDEDIDGPYIDTELLDTTGNKIIEIKKNNLLLCNFEFDKKVVKRDHILILDKNGEIIIESRVFNKDTIIISGRFVINDVILTITQNYILLPDGKRIMHSKFRSDHNSVTITDQGILSKSNEIL